MKLEGKVVVAQGGGPTAVINQSLAGVVLESRKFGQISKVYGAVNGVEGIINEDFVDLTQETTNNLESVARTPSSALFSTRDKPDEEYCKEIFKVFRAHNVRYFFYIGGNDSADTVRIVNEKAELSDYEFRAIHIPKTIDNDLVLNDHTPGYGSAAKYIAASVQEILRDCAVYTVPAVTIVEIMGRDAGWLTAAAALPGLRHGVAPDFVYLPERVFDMEKFFEDIESAFARHPNVVVAVSEGLRFADGTYVGEGAQSGVRDVFGHKYLAGTGKALEEALKDKFGCKTRSVELNILQRCASHMASETDLRESDMIGRAAVERAAAGETGKMMCFERVSDAPYRVEPASGEIAVIANRVRCVPDEFITERGNNVTGACLRYIEPLIQGEPKLEYEDGLPKHFVIPR